MLTLVLLVRLLAIQMMMMSPAADSLVIAGFAGAGTDTTVGYLLTTSLVDGSPIANLCMAACYTNSGSRPSSAAFTTSNAASVGFIIEIAAAGGTTGTVAATAEVTFR